MFLDFYDFREHTYKSPACRKINYFYNNLNFSYKFKKLSLKKKWNAGRNDSGRIIMWSKKSLLIKQKSIKINYDLKYLKLGFLVNFQFIPFKNKLLSLIFFSNGAVTYFLTTENHKLFGIIHFNRFKKLKKIKLINTFLMLFQIKKLSFVSYLELIPNKGAQYSRSSGTSSRIIKFEKNTHSALIQLPSGFKKSFSYYSFVLLGRIALFENKRYSNTKSGYWRSFGVKPVVRGVAMNPIDHPHGGRTKAIRYQRTPWGKTTKYK